MTDFTHEYITELLNHKKVDEIVREFVQDSTEDNAAIMVRAILEQHQVRCRDTDVMGPVRLAANMLERDNTPVRREAAQCMIQSVALLIDRITHLEEQLDALTNEITNATH